MHLECSAILHRHARLGAAADTFGSSERNLPRASQWLMDFAPILTARLMYSLERFVLLNLSVSSFLALCFCENSLL